MVGGGGGGISHLPNQT